MKNLIFFIIFLMTLPFFYNNHISPGTEQLILTEDTSRHIVQVLRMKTGDQLKLTDGRGHVFITTITDAHKKKAVVKILSYHVVPGQVNKISIAISLIKSSNRFEWFLEKVTELGVNEIIPLLCARTEKQHFRFERMQGILISALLQSQQAWLPVLHEPIPFTDLVTQKLTDCKKYIAHCLPGEHKARLHQPVMGSAARLILIGPEGDFTKEEIDEALQNNFAAVALGETRLRTETAGIVAATILRLNAW